MFGDEAVAACAVAGARETAPVGPMPRAQVKRNTPAPRVGNQDFFATNWLRFRSGHGFLDPRRIQTFAARLTPGIRGTDEVNDFRCSSATESLPG